MKKHHWKGNFVIDIGEDMSELLQFIKVSFDVTYEKEGDS